jgi:hypothetical protein
MKINGKVIAIREVQEVELIRSKAEDTIKLKVSGYPIGIRRLYESINPKPQPPKIATGVMRVGQKEPETKLDYENEAYGKAIAEWYYLEKFFVICKCLEVDKDLEITNACDNVESIRLFVKELDEAGFSEGDLGKIWDAIETATRIDPKAVEAAKESFAASLT